MPTGNACVASCSAAAGVARTAPPRAPPPAPPLQSGQRPLEPHSDSRAEESWRGGISTRHDAMLTDEAPPSEPAVPRATTVTVRRDATKRSRRRHTRCCQSDHLSMTSADTPPRHIRPLASYTDPRLALELLRDARRDLSHLHDDRATHTQVVCNAMRWNGMEWNATECNGCNGMRWNAMSTVNGIMRSFLPCTTIPRPHATVILRFRYLPAR